MALFQVSNSRTVCLEIRTTFVLHSARTGDEKRYESGGSWSVYYAEDQTNDAAEWIQRYHRFRGAGFTRNLANPTALSKTLLPCAVHPSSACRNLRLPTQTFVANLLPCMRSAPRAKDASYRTGSLLAQQKGAHVGGLRATYAGWQICANLWRIVCNINA